MDNEARFDGVTTIGSRDPNALLLRPIRAQYLCLHERNIMQLVLLSDDLTVLEGLSCVGIALLWNKTCLFKEREVDERFNIA